jgi:hypothetical protein
VIGAGRWADLRRAAREGGHDVTFVDTWKEHVDAINARACGSTA